MRHSPRNALAAFIVHLLRLSGQEDGAVRHFCARSLDWYSPVTNEDGPIALRMNGDLRQGTGRRSLDDAPSMSRIEDRSMSRTDQHVGLAVVVDIHANVRTRSLIGDKGPVGQMHQQPLPPISWNGKDLSGIERLLRVTLARYLWQWRLQQSSGQQIPGAEDARSKRSQGQPFYQSAATYLTRPVRMQTPFTRPHAGACQESFVVLLPRLRAREK